MSFRCALLAAEGGMKIEICESLVFSWLRHVQGCLVTQTSWKPSPTWSIARERELTEMFEAVRTFAGQGIGLQIFKNGSFSQFIRQAEIDVLGVRWNQDVSSPNVIAVDSAFHEAGLQYGNADETVGRVLKKLIRGAFALDACLDVREASVIFATPKMAEPVREHIERHLSVLEACLARLRDSGGPRFRFRIIANADFSSEILDPVLAQVGAVADTSELFVRSQQLMRLHHSSPREGPSGAETDWPMRATNEEGDRIGEHVRANMAALAASGRLTVPIIRNLLDPRYCKSTFNLGLPFLKRVEVAAPLSRQRIDGSGYARYWKQPLRIADQEFFMCSQWFVWQRDAFDAWLRDIGGSPAPTHVGCAF
jgi:hypothetical protein